MPEHIEQMTAAPGETRDVQIPLQRLEPCGKCGSLAIHVRLVETTVPGDRYRTYLPGEVRCDQCGATRV